MTTRFRLLTANLLQDQSNPSDFARLLAEQDPDVVVAQELAHEVAEVIASHYPNHYLRPALDFSGRGLASRFEGDVADISLSARNAVGARLHVGDELVRVVGIHLLNPLDFPWWRSIRHRTAQVDGLIRWVGEGSGPVVVAGDFNASPSWPAYQRVASHLEDLVAASGEPPRPTWGYRPGWPRVLRIDHFFGRGVTASKIAVCPVQGSDHAAIIADIELTDAA